MKKLRRDTHVETKKKVMEAQSVDGNFDNRSVWHHGWSTDADRFLRGLDPLESWEKVSSGIEWRPASSFSSSWS